MAFGVIRPALTQTILAEHPGLTADSKSAASISSRIAAATSRTCWRASVASSRNSNGRCSKAFAREAIISRDVEAAWDDKRTSARERPTWSPSSAEAGISSACSSPSLSSGWASMSGRRRRRVFDPYPFILLNLVLSCLAAIQAPIIMMSQKRQEARSAAAGERLPGEPQGRARRSGTCTRRSITS